MKQAYRILICLLFAVGICVACQPDQPTPEHHPETEDTDMDCFDHYYTSYVYSYHDADSMYLVDP